MFSETYVLLSQSIIQDFVLALNIHIYIKQLLLLQSDGIAHMLLKHLYMHVVLTLQSAH